jgi:hypothetical protein
MNLGTVNTTDITTHVIEGVPYDGSGGQVTSKGKPIGRRSRSRGPPKK